MCGLAYRADSVACGASWWVLCNALVLCDSEVLACQIGVPGRAVARAVKGPGSGGEGGMRARAAAKAASASAWRSRVMLRLSESGPVSWLDRGVQGLSEETLHFWEGQ